jgi:catechol 2,3-dioxygenase-like lactoylglutathione lyase family enzyme
MLQEHAIHATIPASDLERARAFYADKLGLLPAREDPAGLVYQTAGGAWFRLYETPYAGTAQHTVAGWDVEDIEAEVAALKANGVVFEEYHSPQLETVDGIAPRGGAGWPGSRTARATSSAWPRRSRRRPAHPTCRRRPYLAAGPSGAGRRW